MGYEYYSNEGKRISSHNTTSVPLKKKGGFVINPENWEVEIIDNQVVLQSKPGTWVSVETNRCLSNSAYHRCGSGTSWRAYWLKRKIESVYNEDSIDDATIEKSSEFMPIRVPSVRADDIFARKIKIPDGVGVFYLSAGNSKVFSSLVTKSNGTNPDLVTEKFNLDDLTPDRVVVPQSILWTPGDDRLFE